MKEKHLNFSQEDELHGNIQNVTFAKKHGSLVDSGFRDRSHLKYYMYVCIYMYVCHVYVRIVIIHICNVLHATWSFNN